MQTLERARRAGSQHGYCRWLVGVLGEQKVGWLSTAKWRGDDTRNQRNKAAWRKWPGRAGPEPINWAETRPKRTPREDPLSSVALDVHHGMGEDRIVNNTSEAAEVDSLPVAVVVCGDAVEMGVGLKSVEKRATAFGRFNACPEMSGRIHIHTQCGWVTGGTEQGR